MKTVQSIERAFAILDAVAARELGLSEIADEVDLPKSTVSRILRTLEQVGVVTRDASQGAYQIGPKVRTLGRGSGSPADIAITARPYLAMLARELGEDAGLSIADRRDVRIIAQENAENAVLVADWTGAIIPMHVVPAGLVILANWPAARVDQVLAGPLEAATAKSVTDPGKIRQRLEKIRRDGYCWVFGEFSEDLNSVAAPVFATEGVIAAVTVHGPAYRFPQRGTDDTVAQRVVEVAGLLSERFRDLVAS